MVRHAAPLVNKECNNKQPRRPRFFSRRRMLPLSVFFALCAISLALWPVDMLDVRKGAEDGPLLFSLRAPLGTAFATRMVHSVQRTPVIDEYRVQEGRIWGWREHIMSHNAGLPSLRPERGRFLSAPPWMIVEGGGASWPAIRYRVGTEELGKNEFILPRQPVRELWREFPGTLLVLSVRSAMLWATVSR